MEKIISRLIAILTIGLVLMYPLAQFDLETQENLVNMSREELIEEASLGLLTNPMEVFFIIISILDSIIFFSGRSCFWLS